MSETPRSSAPSLAEADTKARLLAMEAEAARLLTATDEELIASAYVAGFAPRENAPGYRRKFREMLDAGLITPGPNLRPPPSEWTPPGTGDGT